jgi:hypothetical protein
LLAAALGVAGCGEGSSPPAALGQGGTTAGSGVAGAAPTVSGGRAGGDAGGAGAAALAGGGATSESGSGGQPPGGSAAGGGAAGTAPIQEGITVSPRELVFGAVQQTSAPAQTVTLTSTGTMPTQLASVTLDPMAAGTPAFELLATPAAATELAAGEQLELQVRFRPTSVALFESSLSITFGESEKIGVGLFGLGTRGLEGDNEPFLKIVLDTLGYDIDVGGAGLLSTTTPLVGSEVAAQRFKAAGAGEIELVPVARYSPEEPIPYGYYTAAGETELGVISNDEYQALNPKTDAGSESSFTAPAGEFGVFTSSMTHKTYTEDSKNAGNQVQHAVRTYPLRDRHGVAIANAFLVCFEEAANGDYQDYVFTLSNVVPVAP